MKGTPEDPRGLIQEAYRMVGISAPECRSIFLDWALGVPPDRETKTEVRRLLNRYAEANPGHPMTQTLIEALDEPASARRRGGRAGRLRDTNT
ncbi:hypothetical protein JQU17_02970 [Ponticoccus sp. SC2-23]|uniref:hypothetical protein n=1 Tax=Alexandriicola marinus TaxID=2081710 RepID=UPI000FD70B86|nr:hypothetical protein [Alexandriicola marinus]MBM1219146.1 hypothetical protein [Ponticoccus sp. SC6-9]MBM1223782.1 hypothetical protein [Ponticoccus sp. SC6-15]MBM1228960.1 hypothetical protein [Ponticoccus sp. SC6-38]MBM1232748.1 hypothetical protein [Ponticoccus sp. SC6-45]MBM1237302.1 hypothetical protein [Ponticoccus sp. SC6-49]MBM1241759.1 hypothetical protein [Ponticoccus sp. SC2-64]MBM1246272.1 hypothetical protein [Ponticoccus sp. SC6-42]MBM1250750.1 hypothetical protein [Pontico